MNRKVWDQLVSTAAIVIAVVMLFVGAAAIYGGNFGRQNVTDRLAPEKVAFPPYEAMSPEEQAAVGSFAGQDVTTGPQAEAPPRASRGSTPRRLRTSRARRTPSSRVRRFARSC